MVPKYHFIHYTSMQKLVRGSLTNNFRVDASASQGTIAQIIDSIITMEKNQTVTSFAHRSFENSPSVLKFSLKLLFSIIKHHWKYQWPAINSFWFIDFLKVLVRWSEIQCTHIRIYKEWINKLEKTVLNLVRFWWNLKWK